MAAFRTTLCYLLFTFIFLLTAHGNEDDSFVFNAENENKFDLKDAKPVRYLLYDVNPGEGFNLRRDVYLRMANLVKLLNERDPWVLVLPPWGRLYHWRSDIQQMQIPWSTFFDLHSLTRHVPVMEFKDFLKVSGGKEIEEVVYLQRYEEGWRDGKWEERYDIRPCVDNTGFREDEFGLWRWWFWGYSDVYASRLICVSVQAEYSTFKEFLVKNTTGKSVFLMRGEQLIHGMFSEWSKEWWTARRSMRFSTKLRKVADQFRKDHLQSTDAADNTSLDEDWTSMKREHGSAVGGPYLAVHMRRQDFLHGHKDDVPSIKETARQIAAALKKQKLNTVFIATDAPRNEVTELRSHLKKYTVVQFEPTPQQLKQYKDGGVAIIDQWICAHARYFIGTSVSTFSFRIHEEREILGFSQVSSFNRLCGDKEKKCEQPSKWTIKYS